MIWDECYKRYLTALEAARLSRVAKEPTQAPCFIVDFTYDYFVDQLNDAAKCGFEGAPDRQQKCDWTSRSIGLRFTHYSLLITHYSSRITPHSSLQL